MAARHDSAAPFEGTTVLAVFAHPDDESLACGGTLARLSDGGARVVLMCASHGERGALTGPAKDNELGRVRAGELHSAAEVLGVRDLVTFDHPDGELRWAEVTDLLAEIVMTVRRFKPAAVITFGEDGLYWHLDHVGVHERTTAALQLLGADAPPLYYVTMPLGVMPAIVERAIADGWTAPPKGFWSLAPNAFGLGAEPPTMIVDVGAWTARKIAAIRCHHSQTGNNGPFARLSDADARRWLGVEHFHRAFTDGSVGSREPVLESLLCT